MEHWASITETSTAQVLHPGLQGSRRVVKEQAVSPTNVYWNGLDKMAQFSEGQLIPSQGATQDLCGSQTGERQGRVGTPCRERGWI